MLSKRLRAFFLSKSVTEKAGTVHANQLVYRDFPVSSQMEVDILLPVSAAKRGICSVELIHLLPIERHHQEHVLGFLALSLVNIDTFDDIEKELGSAGVFGVGVRWFYSL